MGSRAEQRLEEFYQYFNPEDQVLIMINADPDSIASAMSIRRLLWRKVAGTTICTINEIRRPDNLAMIRLLNIKLIHINELERDTHSRVVMVDSQPNHHELLAEFSPDIIIDHHPKVESDAPFQDIRPKYGATASIMTEYIRAAKIKPPARLATALFYAIKVDTSNFERKVVNEDLRAFQFLYKFANVALAKKIEQTEMRPEFLKFFKMAIDNKKMRKDWIYVNLGSSVNPDISVIIADFLMKLENVNWSVVAGIHRQKLIIIFRSAGYRRNAGKIASQSFGKLGSAGGHASMARAEIAVSEIKDRVDYQNDRKLLNWIIKRINQRHQSITNSQ